MKYWIPSGKHNRSVDQEIDLCLPNGIIIIEEHKHSYSGAGTITHCYKGKSSMQSIVKGIVIDAVDREY